MHKNIAFIGAGRVSTALGLYFKNKGFEIQGYLSRNIESTKKASNPSQSTPYTELNALIRDSGIIWITTPDDQIHAVVKQIAELSIEQKKEKLILHASGAHSLSVLEPLQQAGYNIACAHPLLAFGDSPETVLKLDSVWFAIENTADSSQLLDNFFKKCGNRTFRIEPEKKTLYHAAACVLSNYLVTLLDASYQIFEKSGLTKEDIGQATTPLLESVIENIQGKPGSEALTGPIKRGDNSTVQMHLDVLQAYMPEMAELYKLLGRHTMQMINDYKLKDTLG